MRKWTALLLSLIMCLSLCACGVGKDDPDKIDVVAKDEATNDTEDVFDKKENNDSEMTQEAKKILGETVSTDIIRLTVKNAALAYYANNARYSTTFPGVQNVDEAFEPTTDSEDTILIANKGRTLLCLDFIIENTDRNKLRLEDGIISFSVKKNGEYTDLRGFDAHDPDGTYEMNYKWSILAENGGSFLCSAQNVPFDVGDSFEIKLVGILGFDTEDLSEPFDLIVSVLNSSGNYEQFVYTIGN